MLEGDEQELWEIDYEKKIALNISDINFVKNNVSNYVGTIEDFLKEKGLFWTERKEVIVSTGCLMAQKE